MKLYGCFILCILVLTVRASYFPNSDDNDDFQEDLYNRAHDKKQLNAQKRDHGKKPDVRIAMQLDVVPVTPKILVKDPVRIAVFNSGGYDANIQLNYILNDLQTEETLQNSIANMQERDLFIPRIATNIRIRISASDDDIIDWQVYSLKDTYDVCFLIAGTKSNPVFGQCGLPFEQMYKAWTE